MKMLLSTSYVFESTVNLFVLQKKKNQADAKKVIPDFFEHNIKTHYLHVYIVFLAWRYSKEEKMGLL